jgi:hypothetical protein
VGVFVSGQQGFQLKQCPFRRAPISTKLRVVSRDDKREQRGGQRGGQGGETTTAMREMRVRGDRGTGLDRGTVVNDKRGHVDETKQDELRAVYGRVWYGVGATTGRWRATTSTSQAASSEGATEPRRHE